MQVYQEDSDKYVCVNKYYGRSLGVDGFKQTLHQFLHNGFVLRKDLLDPIIQKLKDLHRHIQSHDTYRFYSSSLLIMYDSSSQDDHPGKGLGNDKAGPGSNPVDVRMIDFAHSTHSGFQNDTTVHSGPDQGYLYGLKNLIDVFTDMRWVVVLGKLIVLRGESQWVCIVCMHKSTCACILTEYENSDPMKIVHNS